MEIIHEAARGLVGILKPGYRTLLEGGNNYPRRCYVPKTVFNFQRCHYGYGKFSMFISPFFLEPDGQSLRCSFFPNIIFGSSPWNNYTCGVHSGKDDPREAAAQCLDLFFSKAFLGDGVLDTNDCPENPSFWTYLSLKEWSLLSPSEVEARKSMSLGVTVADLIEYLK